MTEGNRQTLGSEGHSLQAAGGMSGPPKGPRNPRAGIERGNLEALKLPSAPGLLLPSTSHMHLTGPWHPGWHPSCHSMGLWH